METSTIISIQNQLVTHINKTIKASTDDEIVVDKTILTCCPPDEDIRLIMDRRGLAGTVSAEQAEGFAPLSLE